MGSNSPYKPVQNTAHPEQKEIRQSQELIPAIQSMLGSGNTDFTEDTIIGSDINQIRHIFQYLKMEGRTIEVAYQYETFRGKATEVYDDRVIMSIPGLEESPARRLRLRFEALSYLYEFEVLILDFHRESVTFRIPAFIQSAQRRQYRRTFTYDLFMKFIILYRPIFGRRGVGQLVENRFPAIVSELKKDEPDIALLHRIIIDELGKIAPDFEVRFYQEGEARTLMRNIISEEQKTLFVPDIGKIENYFEPFNLYHLVNYSRHFKSLRQKMSKEEAIKEFEEIQKREMRNFVSSYICAPITIFDEVVGQIYLYSNILDSRFIGYEEAQLVDLLAQMFSYALSKSVIARNYFHSAMTRIVNISLGGLLFEVQNRTIFEYLIDHDILKMIIPLRQNVLELYGEVMRFYPSADGYNIGVRFFKSGLDDLKELEEYLFQRNTVTFR